MKDLAVFFVVGFCFLLLLLLFCLSFFSGPNYKMEKFTSKEGTGGSTHCRDLINMGIKTSELEFKTIIGDGGKIAEE